MSGQNVVTCSSDKLYARPCFHLQDWIIVDVTWEMAKTSLFQIRTQKCSIGTIFKVSHQRAMETVPFKSFIWKPGSVFQTENANSPLGTCLCFSTMHFKDCILHVRVLLGLRGPPGPFSIPHLVLFQFWKNYSNSGIIKLTFNSLRYYRC